jgi:hypothetical protein
MALVQSQHPLGALLTFPQNRCPRIILFFPEFVCKFARDEVVLVDFDRPAITDRVDDEHQALFRVEWHPLASVDVSGPKQRCFTALAWLGFLWVLVHWLLNYGNGVRLGTVSSSLGARIPLPKTFERALTIPIRAAPVRFLVG